MFFNVAVLCTLLIIVMFLSKNIAGATHLFIPVFILLPTEDF